MHRIILALLSVILFSCSRNKTQFEILGAVDKAIEGNICIRDESDSILTAKITDGYFKFTGNLEHTERFVMFWESDLQKRSYYIFDFFVEPGSVTELSLNADTIDYSTAKGCFTQDKYNELNGEINRVKQEWITTLEKSNNNKVDQKKLGEFYGDKINNIEMKFINENPNNFISPYLLYRKIGILNASEISNIFKLFSPDLALSKYYKLVSDKLKSTEVAEVGKKIINFKLEDENGELIDYYDATRGKLVLVDLWFSACPPCRRANKNLAKLYDSYREKGFEIVSISVDKNHSEWKKSIVDDKMIWINLIDKNRDSEFFRYYNTNHFPTTYLVDRNGIIIDKNPDIERIKDILTNELGE